MSLPVSARTGEVLRRPIFTKNRGLVFRLSPSGEPSNGYHCSIDGSLHKFANGGEGNADAFTLGRLALAVEDLRRSFHIDPKAAILRNLEIGLNFRLPVLADSFVNHAVSLPDRPFQDFSSEEIYLGKEAARSQYFLKIYDKGRQETGHPSDLLRVELKVKKMQYLDGFQIATLSDLTDPAKVGGLGRLLYDAFSEVIFYDRSINSEHLPERQRRQIAEWSNGDYWHKLERRERYRQKSQFENMVKGHGCNGIFEAVKDAILPAWESLVKSEIEKNWCPLILKKIGDRYEGVKCDDFTVKIKGKIVLNNCHQFFSNKGSFSEGENEGLREGKEGKGKEGKAVFIFCRICGADISHQRAGSLVCSTQTAKANGSTCKGKRFARRKKEQSDAQRASEQKNLKTFLGSNAVKAGAFRLIIHRKGEADGWQIEGSEAGAVLSGFKIQQVVRVEVVSNGEAFTLTTQRAKTVLKAVRGERAKPCKKRRLKQ